MYNINSVRLGRSQNLFIQKSYSASSSSRYDHWGATKH